MQLPSAIHKTVVLEAHRLIEAAVDDALEKLRVGLQADAISYPPGVTIDPLAIEALGMWQPKDAALEAMRALITDACASSMFGMFALLDGVADPEVRDVGTWLGADLIAIKDDEDREMLHDMFFETWHEFSERTARGTRE